MIEIKWHDIDPEMGEKRYISAERFAGVWTFKFKFKKRGEWTKGLVADRVMWLHVLDSYHHCGYHALMYLKILTLFTSRWWPSRLKTVTRICRN